MQTELAWYQALEDVTDNEAKEAFRKLLKKKTFGDPQPSDVIEIVEELRFKKEMDSDPNADLPWISKAPNFEGEKFEDLDRGIPTRAYLAWKQEEEHKRYRSIGRDNEIFLIQNPNAWDWRIINNKMHFIRPEPEATGKFRKEAEKPKPWVSR